MASKGKSSADGRVKAAAMRPSEADESAKALQRLARRYERARGQ